jgi:serum/glucocorticoid-regulated kinase 2
LELWLADVHDAFRLCEFTASISPFIHPFQHPYVADNDNDNAAILQTKVLHCSLMVPRTMSPSWAVQDLLVKVGSRNILTQTRCLTRVIGISVWNVMQLFAWTSNRLGRTHISALCEFDNSGRYRTVETCCRNWVNVTNRVGKGLDTNLRLLAC